MRVYALPMLAAVMLAAMPGAHAGFGPSSSPSISMDRGDGERSSEPGRGFASLPQFGVMQIVQHWLERFQGEDLGGSRAPTLAGGETAGSETRASRIKASGECDHSTAPQEGVDDSDGPKSAEGEDQDAEPTGPEPIYFGF